MADVCEDCGGAYSVDLFETRHTCMPDAIRERERARIVAWLRAQLGTLAGYYADKIEQGAGE